MNGGGRKCYTLLETNSSHLAPEKGGKNPWNLGDSELGNHPFQGAKICQFQGGPRSF